MKLHQIIIFFGLFSFFSGFGQEETAIEEVIISPKSKKGVQLELNSVQIARKIATDVGHLLALFPGIQIRSYGDVGGMKTVSFRSLGAGHTALVQDYSSVSTTQSGQADMSTIPTDFLQKVELITCSPTRTDIPIHAKLAGAVVNCQTIHAFSSIPKHHFLIGFQGGSFSQLEAYTMGGIHKERFGIHVSGKFRSYKGDFPFTYKNGNQVIRDKRYNNGLMEFYGTFSTYVKIKKKHTIQLRIFGNDYEKQLAGAVVFYNSNTHQYLNGYGLNGALNYAYKSLKWDVFSSVNYQNNRLQYLDSNYLNFQGYLDSRYQASQLDFQVQAAYSPTTNISILLGSSAILEQLNSKQFSSVPYRNTYESFLGFQWDKVGILAVQLGAQGVQEKRFLGDTLIWNWLPTASWFFNLGSKQKIGFVYRYTVRQPSFSELYYQQIGNLGLRPEKAHLASLRYELSLPFKQGIFQTMIQPFYTYAYDKILAIPTKNLFIWSIQNIGISSAYGTEFIALFQKKLKQHTIGFRINYTFQYAIDLSNSNSVLYKNILSYSPLHTGNIELNYSWKGFNFFVLNNYVGNRYVLNQNIPANLLDGFYTLDAGAGYTQAFKKNEFTIRATVQNLTNNHYYYINYFVMPGIHFNIRLQYAI